MALVCACSASSSASPTVDEPLAVTVEPVATPTVPPPTPTPLPAPTPQPTISRAAGEVDLGNRERPEMALTFDCGASSVPTPAILQALRDANVRSTFFITGQWASIYPNLTREIAAEHEIANHSWSHPDFATISDARIIDEMRRTEALLTSLGAAPAKPLWRAPFGSRNRRILSLLQSEGWVYHIYWSADSGDWTDISPAQVRANVAKAARNGAIIVQHCGSTQTAAALPQIIADLKSKGLKLVPISELLRD